MCDGDLDGFGGFGAVHISVRSDAYAFSREVEATPAPHMQHSWPAATNGERPTARADGERPTLSGSPSRTRRQDRH
jgi:hypothetical protein